MWRLFPFCAGFALALLQPASSVLADAGRTISEVRVQQEGGTTQIVLRGPEHPVYTAFMRNNPPRLIVELPEIAVEAPNTPIEVHNGLVDSVTVGTFGDKDLALNLARVSIALASGADYELKPGNGELVVELRPAGTPAASAPTAKATPATPAAAPVPAAPAEDAGNPNWKAAAEGDLAGVDPAKDGAQPEGTSAPAQTPGADTNPPAPTGSETAAENPATPPSGIGQPIASTPMESLNPGEAPAKPAATKKKGGAKTAAKGSADKGEAKTAAKNSGPLRITHVVPGGDRVKILANRPLEQHELFPLQDPDRLVVDLPGARSSLGKPKLDVAEGPVSQIRIGEHAGKLRVVLDLRNKVGKYRFETTPDGASIHFDDEAAAQDAGAGTPVSDAGQAGAEGNGFGAPPADGSVPAAPSEEGASEPAPTPLPPGQFAQVRSAHFESTGEFDRVVVSFDHQIEAKVVEPDSDTLIVRLVGAQIDREHERRVDTKEFGGPVQIFSIFQTPDVAEPEVRIVLKRHAKVPGQLHWSGDQLTLELSRSADTLASAPTPVPDSSASSSSAGGGTAPTVPGAQVAKTAPGAEPAADGEDDMSVGDPFAFAGPADPASIDILEEGGFSPDKAYSGRRISLDFKDADMGNILRLIAEVSDLNVIAGEEVSGKVTIRLVDVPWDQALDVILLTKGLGFERKGNVLRIAPLETLKLEKEARLSEARAREKLEDLQVKLQPVNYADVEKVKNLVKRLLSKRGSVDVDERTSTLIIKDIPSVVQESTALVKAIDTATPQVMIEAKIVEANLNFSRSLGTLWSLGYRALGSRGGAQDLRFADSDDPNNFSSDDISGLPALTNNFASANPVIGTPTGLLNLGLLSLDDHLQLDLQLQAAEQNDKGKVISSPRVVTLDNTEADIKQGVAIAFSEATLDKVTTTFIDAVLELKVTPHITADRSIIMKIYVTRNAPQLSAATGKIAGIAKNESKTEALVRDGETVVLGGIYVVDTAKKQSKVPFLADLPLIGPAFKSNSLNDVRRELLIFVTPRVVTGGGNDAAL